MLVTQNLGMQIYDKRRHALMIRRGEPGQKLKSRGWRRFATRCVMPAVPDVVVAQAGVQDILGHGRKRDRDGGSGA